MGEEGYVVKDLIYYIQSRPLFIEDRKANSKGDWVSVERPQSPLLYLYHLEYTE